MDTPEKSKIGTPVSKFEDSPVFNYINSLSPIKPVKSLHITQTFSSLNFGSLPSVFTSPHVASHKESRFLRRYSVSDLSKPEFSSENGGKVEEGVVVDPGQLYDNSAEQPESSALVVSNGESSGEPLNESSKFVIELPLTLSYDSGSPDCVKSDFASELVEPSTSLDPSSRGAIEKGPSGGETRYDELCLSEQRKEGSVCDWESLISDSADILIFNSPNGSEGFKGLSHNPLEPETRFCFPQGNVNSEHQMQVVGPVSSEQQREELFSQTGEACQLSDFDPMEDMFYNHANTNTGMASDPSERKGKEAETQVVFSSKSVLSLHRGVRRRCLDFEMVGARTKNLDDGSNGSSSRSQPNERITANEKKLGPLRLCESSRRVLPGIGLHLNALATTTSKDSLSSGIQIRMPNSNIPSLHSPTTGQEALEKSLVPGSGEVDSNSNENGVQLLQDDSLATDEFNQNSPKKKRRRLENAGETEGCKRCNCKKSKCLKLYCECFAAGVYCIEPCSCQECFNKPVHEDTVLATRQQIESRNPLAFAPKVIRGSDSVPEYAGHEESSKTPASARHKRGCNCKKSSCLKKYCECYQGGVGCSINCRCEGCKNAFGRKDGSSALIDAEAEPDKEEETDIREKSTVNKTCHNSEGQNVNGSTLPITPLRIPSRPLVPLPFSSKGKPPRSSFLNVATSSSSSGLYGHKLAKPSILRSLPKIEKHAQTVPDNAELPEILRCDGSPVAGIKTLSPNSKRISPPHCHLGSPAGRRSGRKLILQSIPSFPSLTPHQ